MEQFLQQLASGLANGAIYACVALALDLATHAYVLETGRVVMSGPSEVVKNDENVRKSYLGY